MTKVLVMAAIGLLGACASAPTKEPPAPITPPPVVAAPPPTQGEKLPPLPFLHSSKKLGSYQCSYDFDCYDTAGFPSSGHRWECEKNKCLIAPLPNQMGGTIPAAENAEKSKGVKSSSSVSKSRSPS